MLQLITLLRGSALAKENREDAQFAAGAAIGDERQQQMFVFEVEFEGLQVQACGSRLLDSCRYATKEVIDRAKFQPHLVGRRDHDVRRWRFDRSRSGRLDEAWWKRCCAVWRSRGSDEPVEPGCRSSCVRGWRGEQPCPQLAESSHLPSAVGAQPQRRHRPPCYHPNNSICWAWTQYRSISIVRLGRLTPALSGSAALLSFRSKTPSTFLEILTQGRQHGCLRKAAADGGSGEERIL